MTTPVTHISLDLETMGTRPGSAVVSIGAVLFDFDMTALRVEKFAMEYHRRITLQSCLSVGLTVDGPTVEWWLRQSDAARQGLLQQPAHVNVVLLDFVSWIDLCLQHVSRKRAALGVDRPLRVWAMARRSIRFCSRRRTDVAA